MRNGKWCYRPNQCKDCEVINLIIEELVKYYELLAEDPNSNIATRGYCQINVSYALVISAEGKLLNVMDLKILDEHGKKYIPQTMMVPQHVTRASGICANFICDNSSYVIGLYKKDATEKTITKIKEQFKAFKALTEQVISDVECKEAKAMLAFLDNWDITTASENQLFNGYIDDLLKGANLVFKLDGENSFIHQNPMIKQAWELYLSKSKVDAQIDTCAVTGKKDTIARIHTGLKGLRGGKPTGNPLICFQKGSTAFESYGNKDSQGLNAHIGEYAAFAYTTVLNRMLADNSHIIRLGDSTVVFWAISKKCNFYQDFFYMAMEPSEIITAGTEKQKYVRDKTATSTVKAVLDKTSKGEKISSSFTMNDDTKFFILALSPNAARVSVRFFLQDSFDVFIDRINRHYEDLCIEKQFDNNPDYISVWQILNETVSPKATDKSASPLVSGAVLRAILSGAPYPAALIDNIIIRIKAEKEVNYIKAATIKAYYLRNNSTNNYKEVLTVSLNKNSSVKPYVLGRLFAILEQIQKSAYKGKKLNTTIKDRYFTSACANPALTFPVLLKLSNHHIAKNDYGIKYDKKIENVLEKLSVEDNPFPKNLTLEDQGKFYLGYYHERNNIHNEIIKATEEKKMSAKNNDNK